MRKTIFHNIRNQGVVYFACSSSDYIIGTRIRHFLTVLGSEIIYRPSNDAGNPQELLRQLTEDVGFVGVWSQNVTPQRHQHVSKEFSVMKSQIGKRLSENCFVICIDDYPLPEDLVRGTTCIHIKSLDDAGIYDLLMKYFIGTERTPFPGFAGDCQWGTIPISFPVTPAVRIKDEIAICKQRMGDIRSQIRDKLIIDNDYGEIMSLHEQYFIEYDRIIRMEPSENTVNSIIKERFDVINSVLDKISCMGNDKNTPGYSNKFHKFVLGSLNSVDRNINRLRLYSNEKRCNIKSDVDVHRMEWLILMIHLHFSKGDIRDMLPFLHQFKMEFNAFWDSPKGAEERKRHYNRLVELALHAETFDIQVRMLFNEKERAEINEKHLEDYVSQLENYDGFLKRIDVRLTLADAAAMAGRENKDKVLKKYFVVLDDFLRTVKDSGNDFSSVDNKNPLNRVRAIILSRIGDIYMKEKEFAAAQSTYFEAEVLLNKCLLDFPSLLTINQDLGYVQEKIRQLNIIMNPMSQWDRIT